MRFLALCTTLAIVSYAVAKSNYIKVEMRVARGMFERHRIGMGSLSLDMKWRTRRVASRFRSITKGVTPLSALELVTSANSTAAWTLRYRDTRNGTALIDNLLQTVAPIFERHGIRYLLNYGTLLGAVRDGDYMHFDYKISHAGPFPDSVDRDIDLAAFAEDRPNLLRGTPFEFDIAELGCWIEHEETHKTRIYAQAGAVVVHLDLWWYQRVLANTVSVKREVYVFNPKKYGWYMIPAVFFDSDKTSKIKLGGRFYPAPWRPDILMELFYGEMWRTPIAKDPGDPAGSNEKGHEDFANFIEVVQVDQTRSEFRIKETLWSRLAFAASSP